MTERLGNIEQRKNVLGRPGILVIRIGQLIF